MTETTAETLVENLNDEIATICVVGLYDLPETLELMNDVAKGLAALIAETQAELDEYNVEAHEEMIKSLDVHLRDDWIAKMAREVTAARYSTKGMRTGQILFNSFPADPADALCGSPIDPFFKELSEKEVWEWIENHVIFDGEGICIALYDGNKLVWEQ
jgi:hypothetical protein